MNITILGASAGVGLNAVERALERGHHVTALSRSTDAYPQNPNLTVIKGSATNPDDVKKAIAGADAVLVTLGTGMSTKPTTLYTDAAKVLIQVQQETQTQVPFIILTGFGAGDSGNYHSFIMGLVFKFILKAVYENKTQMEQAIAQSPLNWEFVRPGLLTKKPATGKYRTETRYYKGMNIGSIARADVADFMVQQAEHPMYLKEYVALGK
jgi:putative NADH-flavin reductase